MGTRGRGKQGGGGRSLFSREMRRLLVLLLARQEIGMNPGVDNSCDLSLDSSSAMFQNQKNNAL